MSAQMIGLIVGGLLPAIFYGLSAVFAKASNSAGIGLGYYILTMGAAAVMTGFVCLVTVSDRTFSLAAGRDAFLAGATWAIGSVLVAIALARFKAPIAQLVPLYNMNTLVGVLLGLWIFAEWQGLNVPYLLIGSVLIIIGGTLVAWA